MVHDMPLSMHVRTQMDGHEHRDTVVPKKKNKFKHCLCTVYDLIHHMQSCYTVLNLFNYTHITMQKMVAWL